MRKTGKLKSISYQDSWYWSVISWNSETHVPRASWKGMVPTSVRNKQCQMFDTRARRRASSEGGERSASSPVCLAVSLDEWHCLEQEKDKISGWGWVTVFWLYTIMTLKISNVLWSASGLMRTLNGHDLRGVSQVRPIPYCQSHWLHIPQIYWHGSQPAIDYEINGCDKASWKRLDTLDLPDRGCLTVCAAAKGRSVLWTTNSHWALMKATWTWRSINRWVQDQMPRE